MPPRLNPQGHPVGQRRRPRATKVYFCTCNSCSVAVTWNPLDNKFIAGRTVGRKEYLRHRRINNNYEASSSVSEDPPNPREPSTEPPPSSTSSIPSGSPNSVICARFDQIEAELRLRQESFSVLKGLVFAEPPTPTSEAEVAPPEPFSFQNDNASSEINSGPYALVFERQANRPVLEYLLWLHDTLLEVDGVSGGNEDRVRAKRKAIVDSIQEEFIRVEDLKMDEWQRQRLDQETARSLWKEGRVPVMDTGMYLYVLIFSFPLFIHHSAAYFLLPLISEHKLLNAVYLIAAVLSVIGGLSLDHSSFLLVGMQVVLELAWSKFSDDTSESIHSLLRAIPSRLPTIIEQLELKPRSRGYVCCGKCFACYDLDNYPDHCTQKQNAHASHRICRAPLRKEVRRKGQLKEIEVRKYLHHDLKHWMGRMLSRPDFEKYLDRDVFDTESAPVPVDDDDREMHDIWDGNTLREFCGPDGRLFIKGKPRASEGRYVFSMCMDDFNPYHNKQAGKKVSVGAIYMVLLNLPPHLRYRVENVFLVGIIPGPSKPSIERINEILKPLVNDLLPFWDPGVYFSRTFRYAKGRLVRCVVIPLVCDLPAVRQMAGFAGHSSTHFCSFCLLPHDQIGNLNPKE